MAVWQTSPVSQTPGLRLSRWSIHEVPFDENSYPEDMGEPSFHFVGVNETEGGEGRVSSAIRTFDKETMSGETRSGRVYTLVGGPGASMDALYVWSRWKQLNKVSDSKEVDLETFCSKISVPKERK